MIETLEQIVRCPVCGIERMRVTKVDAFPVGPAKQQVTATGRGVTLGYAPIGGHGRGNTVEITFECENGHETTFSLDFHKGSTFLAHRSRDITAQVFTPTLWRD